MKGLTERQREVLDFIIKYKVTNDVSPTFQEIANHFDVYINAVMDMMKRMRKKVCCHGNQARPER